MDINLDGDKEVLALCVTQSDGARIWLTGFTKPANRSIEDSFIA